MAKILLLIVVGFIAYGLFRGFSRAQVRRDEERTAKPAATTARGEDMVRCARCGVNLPRSEAVEDQGRLVCASNPGCRPGA
jgi:uncharacterized protein